MPDHASVALERRVAAHFAPHKAPSRREARSRRPHNLIGRISFNYNAEGLDRVPAFGDPLPEGAMNARFAAFSFIVHACGEPVIADPNDCGAGVRLHIVYSSFSIHSGGEPLGA
jgi:hypothetical protein